MWRKIELKRWKKINKLANKLDVQSRDREKTNKNVTVEMNRKVEAAAVGVEKWTWKSGVNVARKKNAKLASMWRDLFFPFKIQSER